MYVAGKWFGLLRRYTELHQESEGAQLACLKSNIRDDFDYGPRQGHRTCIACTEKDGIFQHRSRGHSRTGHLPHFRVKVIRNERPGLPARTIATPLEGEESCTLSCRSLSSSFLSEFGELLKSRALTSAKNQSFFIRQGSTEAAYEANTTLNYGYRHLSGPKFRYFDPDKMLTQA